MAALALFAFLAAWGGQERGTVLENAHVKVSRNQAPCAAAGTAGCGDRIVVALGPLELSSPGNSRLMARGDIAVFLAGESYPPPLGGDYVEVTVKPERPPVESPSILIPPEKNSIVFDGERFFIFEEKLEPGDTRPRHSHSERVVVVLNQTRLQQWPEGDPEVFKNQVPDRVAFNPPVIHVVKNIGEKPLRNIVIEFKPETEPATK
jgi:quercetin dioxygenase-like cupin family protein